MLQIQASTQASRLPGRSPGNIRGKAMNLQLPITSLWQARLPDKASQLTLCTEEGIEAEGDVIIAQGHRTKKVMEMAVTPSTLTLSALHAVSSMQNSASVTLLPSF